MNTNTETIKKIIFNHINEGLYKNGNRSSHRTDKMHHDILELIKLQIPNFDAKYDVFFETNVQCAYGNKFKIDILIKDKSNNIVVCILLKALISSIQKNRNNYANTTRGEIYRIKNIRGRDNVKLWFITLIGNETPTYKNNGCLKNMEQIDNSYVDFSKYKESDETIYFSTIRYDLNGIDYSTKDSFRKTLNVNNIKNITENTLYDNARKIL